MGDGEVTITFHLWWLWAYLGIGVVLYLPLNWLVWRRKDWHGDFSFWRSQWANLRRDHFLPLLVQVVAWPLSIWEDFR